MEINAWGVDSTWTLFLDRDGVINDRIYGGYVLDWKDFHFLPGVLENLAHVRGKFARIVVVTNQQCVALGKISQEELALIHDQMCQQVADSGGCIDMVFAAIELKNDPASRRKPNINMALEAQRQFPEIDFSKSIMVGDTGTDLLFGQALGMKTVLIESQELVTVPSDFRCNALSTFLHKI